MFTFQPKSLKRDPRAHRAFDARAAFLLAMMVALAAPVRGAALKSGRLVIAIEESTGALQRITDLRDGRVLAGPSYDAYTLQPAPEAKLTASESEDRVVTRQGEIFVCENPKLPQISIEKSYAVENSILTKHVAFKAAGKDLGFLQYSTASNVPEEFYKPGYLNNPSRHVVNKALPYFNVAGIEKEFKVSDFNPRGDHHLVIFTNPVINRGLAQYRFKVDGQFVHPLTSYTYEPGLYYSPQGWRMAVAAKWLSQDRDEFSCDVQWHVFDGDHLAFHTEYLNLPEWKAVWDTDVPAWMEEVKGIVTWDFAKDTASGFPQIKAAADSLARGYLMVLIRGVFHNTRAYMSDPIPGAHGQPLARSQLQEWIRQLRALSPRIKIGPITWQWAFLDKDPVFREHPEWTVHGADGKPAVVVTAWEGEKAAAQLLTPECRRFVVEQFAGIAKTYNFDFIYMDTGQGGITMLDWRTKRSAQDYDWALLYKGIRDAARLNGGGSFYNGIPNLFSLYSDIGYYEGYHPYREHWQARSDRLVLAKVYQRPVAKRTIPLYWDNNNWTTESYPKLCYALAVKPGGFDWRGEFDALRWPVTGSLWEIERAELMPASRWEPCWWRQTTEMEVYALRLGDAGLLTVYSHANARQSVDVSFDLGPFGFDPSKPVHIWRFDPKTVAELDRENADRLTEAQASELFARTGRAPLRGVTASFVANVPYPKDGRLARPIEVEGDRVAILMVTQARMLAYARNLQPTHFLLPAAGVAGERTVRADQALPATVAENRKLRASTAREAPVVSTPRPSLQSEGVQFQGDAVIHSFSGGAKLVGTSIDIPAGGAIEATGLAVTTIKVLRPASAPRLEIWITYSRGVGQPFLYKHVIADLEADAEKELPLDLNHFAPPGWSGRVRLETRGEGGFVRIIFNSRFQLF